MSRLIIRARNANFEAELDDSDISNAIWLECPHKLDINMLGSMIYCELPLKVLLPKEGRTQDMEVGDIAYWPGPGAFCIFFGPTPLSGEDGKPVAPYPMIKIGKVLGDCSGLSEAGDRQRLTLDQSF
ncbi:MAG: AfsR family transcriptional regulator [Candidatus Methanomethylophilaceae archaeon]|nr:AfsR family transcriptional regulator [Candidatus Methanomethylophilaceae archaeon]